MSDPEETDWADYQTGPFCRHWGDPSDCAIKCAACGHGCTEHAVEDGRRECFECPCPWWVEPGEETEDVGED